MPQKSMKSGKELEAPTQMLARAVAASPPPRRSVGCVRAPKTPDANLETPYMTGRTEVRAPTDWRKWKSLVFLEEREREREKR
jgi:hypothetical protein